MIAAGIALVVCGAIYLRWPMIFRRGLWLKTSVAIRVLSEKNYQIYMRTLGGLFILAGVVLIALRVSHYA
jgi:hypothetical protein